MTNPLLDPSLFRQNAINNLNMTHDLQPALKIITPHSYIALLIAACAFASALIWCLFGTLTLYIDAPGIIMPTISILESERLLEQNIADNREKIIALDQLYNKKKKLHAKHYLTETDLLRAKEEFISAKENLANPNRNIYVTFPTSISSNPQHQSSLTALAFINPTQGKRLSPGMKTYLLPTSLPAYAYGYIKGFLETISDYPISKQVAYSYLKNMNLADEFFATGTPFLAKIQLLTNPSDPTQFLWTTQSRPLFAIQAGTLVAIKIIQGQCTPLKFLTDPQHCH